MQCDRAECVRALSRFHSITQAATMCAAQEEAIRTRALVVTYMKISVARIRKKSLALSKKLVIASIMVIACSADFAQPVTAWYQLCTTAAVCCLRWHIHTHVGTHTCARVCARAHTYTHTHTHVHTLTHTHTRTHTHTQRRAHTRAHTHTQRRTHTHTHTHTHIRAHTHTCTHTRTLKYSTDGVHVAQVVSLLITTSAAICSFSPLLCLDGVCFLLQRFCLSLKPF